LRPVSLRPVRPEGVQSERVFPEKWPVTKLPKKNISPPMLFYGRSFTVANIKIFMIEPFTESITFTEVIIFTEEIIFMEMKNFVEAFLNKFFRFTRDIAQA